jgi:3,4-dihydroxy-9,10-secoandrosta-1,3,5(10)-triene-9,17-dione 4,5-dioxygenase
LISPFMDQWQVFARDLLGLMPVDGADPQAQYYRMDHFPERLVVTPGPEPRAEAIGFEVANERALHEVMERLDKSGTKVSDGSAEEAAARRVTGFARFDDPAGSSLEIFYGPVLTHASVQTPTVSKFVTGEQGMGHVIVTAEDIKPAYEFYTEVLGFVERNSMKIPDLGSLYFLGCNSRHHTLGILPLPGPGRLVHFMVEAATLDDVGYALDRAHDLGIPLQQSLGKHTNDCMISFYVLSPENLAVEFGWNGLQVHGEQPTYEITQGAFWGHKTPSD